MPPVAEAGLWPAQIKAVRNPELSLHEDRPRSLSKDVGLTGQLSLLEPDGCHTSIEDADAQTYPAWEQAP